MRSAIDKEYAHLGETYGSEDHDRDMIHELSRRLDSLWRCDQYIANAEGDGELQSFWRDVKKQEQTNIQRLKSIIRRHVEANCF
ncbi:hypothetical protein PHYC_03126 [Phycisphaerales bacterium]|nr:hypothetical protein PHYC_03126 [Phycisphaerales bacterium]